MIKHNYTDVTDWSYNITSINKAMYNGNVVFIKYEDDGYHPYLHKSTGFIALEDGAFSFSGTSKDNIHNSVSYSLDNGQTWVALPNGEYTPTLHAGDRILWKGINHPIGTAEDSGASEDTYLGIGTFSSTCRFSLEGNPLSLIYGDNFENQSDFSTYLWVYDALFKNCNKLVDASNFIIAGVELPTRCYRQMFANCTSLTKAPVLPSNDLSLNCYLGMFKNCTSLVVAPNLGAKTLAAGCYARMFQGCTALQNAPKLEAKVLANDCYDNMFDGCTSLKNVTCLATDMSSGTPTSFWLRDVAERGTFHKARGVEWSRDNSGIPANWTVIEE